MPLFFEYVSRESGYLQRRGTTTPLMRLRTTKAYFNFALTIALWAAPLVFGQQALQNSPVPAALGNPENLFHLETQRFQTTTSMAVSWANASSPNYLLYSARPDSSSFSRPRVSFYPNSIERMENAFYCNDTPFIDQVRLPIASLWRGRLKLIGFESDVTTANFILGLPGQGALHSLNLMGSGHLAVHAPPSDQMGGLHLSFTFKGSSTEQGDNSAFHGIEYVFRASRNLLPGSHGVVISQR